MEGRYVMIKNFVLCALAGLLLCNCSFASDCEIKHESVKFYKQFTKEQPGFVCSYYNLANEYKLKNKYQDALNTYDDIIEINPQEEIAYKRRAEIYSKFNNENKANHEYARLVKNIPDSVNGNYHMALIYENIYEYETALKYIDRVIELLGDREYDKAGFYEVRANILKKMGRYEEAIEDYTKFATSEHTYNYSVYWDISDCYKALGNDAKAKEAERKWDAAYYRTKHKTFLAQKIKSKYSDFKTKFHTEDLY